jgi:AcrR family transcriptional regulator
VTTASEGSATRRARRQRLSPEQRREQLIRATVSVVSRLGYRNASLAAVAAEAGMSKGLLWHYFADGDELMEAAARATLINLRDAVAADLDLSAPIPQVIRAAIHRAAALHQTHRAELRAMREIVDNLRHPDGTHRLGLEEYEQTYQQQAALFQRGVDEGSLRRLDTRYLAVIYQGAVDAMLDYLDAHPDTDADRYATTVADILLDGITTR